MKEVINMSVEDKIVTMPSRFRVYADDDNSFVLLNLATGEAQALDLDEVFLEFESNYREYDGPNCAVKSESQCSRHGK